MKSLGCKDDNFTWQKLNKVYYLFYQNRAFTDKLGFMDLELDSNIYNGFTPYINSVEFTYSNIIRKEFGIAI